MKSSGIQILSGDKTKARRSSLNMGGTEDSIALFRIWIFLNFALRDFFFSCYSDFAVFTDAWHPTAGRENKKPVVMLLSLFKIQILSSRVRLSRQHRRESQLWVHKFWQPAVGHAHHLPADHPRLLGERVQHGRGHRRPHPRHLLHHRGVLWLLLPDQPHAGRRGHELWGGGRTYERCEWNINFNKKVVKINRIYWSLSFCYCEWLGRPGLSRFSFDSIHITK